MATLREEIHELGNWHNKISMAAMVTNELLVGKKIAKMTDKERDEVMKKVIQRLKKIEEYVVNADKLIEEIKPFLYEQAGADTEIPLKSK